MISEIYGVVLFFVPLDQDKTFDELDEYVMFLEAHRIKVSFTILKALCYFCYLFSWN